jgi:hypothetical protein
MSTRIVVTADDATILPKSQRGTVRRKKKFLGVVVLTEVHTSGNKVRVKSGDFILNVDEKQVAKDD